jgi:hypothetical protein
MLIVILLVPNRLAQLISTTVVETTLRLLADDNLVVNRPECLPWLLIVLGWEPIWEEGTTGISIWKSNRRSGRDMVLSALLAVLKLDAVGNQDSWVSGRRNQEVRIVVAETLKAGLGNIIDCFDEVSALLRRWVEAGSGSRD